jgi:hypothetical protein
VVPIRNTSERRAFHHFTQRGPLLSTGTVDAKFWEETAPRLAHTHDFVWDVIVCSSLLDEHVSYASMPAVYNAETSAPINDRHREALAIYSRAISKVRTLAAHQDVDESAIALSYLLFASVEFHHRSKCSSTCHSPFTRVRRLPFHLFRHSSVPRTYARIACLFLTRSF